MRNETVIQRQEHSETDNLQKQKQNEFYQPQYNKLHTSPAERHEMTDSVNRIRFYPLNLYLCFISAFLFIYYFIFLVLFCLGVFGGHGCAAAKVTTPLLTPLLGIHSFSHEWLRGSVARWLGCLLATHSRR